jgi:hypothetical protein
MDSKSVSVEERRKAQQEAGFEVLPQLQLVEVDMANEEVQSRSARTKNGKPEAAGSLQVAAQSVREVVLQSMTWRQVIAYELKKAAVWTPIIATTLLGTLWASKRLFKL